VKKPHHTEKRGGQWWYRRRVPAELVPFVGRAEFRESLKTPDIEVARTRAAFKDAAVAIEFERAREQLRLQANVSALPEELSPEERRYISDAVRAHVLDEDESVRLARPDPDSMDAYESIRADQFDDAVAALRSGRVAVGRHEKERVVKLLEAIGLSVSPGSPAWDVAAFKATEGLNQALRDISQRMTGNFIPTPTPPPVPSGLVPRPTAATHQNLAGVSLGDVINHYLMGLPENGFKRKVRRCLQLFGELVGRDLKVGELRQKAVTQFLRDICRLPDKWARRFDSGESIAAMLAKEAEKVMSPTTYEGNYRAPLGTFLTSAAQNFGDDGLRLLSVDGIRYTGNRVPEEDQQRALLDDELKVLFEGEAFARVATDLNSEPLYWLLVVMLFTGARPREVCQINPQVDFGEIEGAWFIDLDNKSAAGVGIKKSIKTGEARRVPLHAELVRLGFPKYLQRSKEAGVDRLFPSWRVKAGNPFTAHHGLIAGLLKETGLYTRTAPAGEQVTGAYVLRKTFVTQCRNQGVVSREITGHRDGATTVMQDRHYVFGPEPFQRKVEQLAKLKMPVTIPKAVAMA
jgi:integrase